jgi:hypothetical protein
MATRTSGRRVLCLWLLLCLAGAFLPATSALAAKAASKPSTKSSKKGSDLTVIDYERWLDTLKGTVKNFGPGPARDVTVMVRFVDKKNKVLGMQSVSVGDLDPGRQSSWSIAIAEKNRQAVRYDFEVHAIKP